LSRFKLSVCRAALFFLATLSFGESAAAQNYFNCFNSAMPPLDVIASCDQTIASDPRHAQALQARGAAWQRLGEYDRAIADFSQSINIDPNYIRAFYSRGLAWEKKGDLENALADFKYFADVDPTGFTDVQNAIARVNRTKKKIEALASKSPMAGNTAIGIPPPAAEKRPSVPLFAQPATADKRVALVIGNAAYRNVPALSNPRRDAILVAGALKRSGFFAVTLQTDLQKDALVTALRAFAQQAEAADWAVVYYAGHGMEIGGTNYLIPVDAKLTSDRDIGFEAVPLDYVLNATERAKKLHLVVLDACRDNPFAAQMKRTMTLASRSVSRGLASIEPDAGTLVVYSAKDGETALDGAGDNSPFALAFVKNLETPGLEVRRLFDVVRDDVMELTGGRQKPFNYGSISGRQDFYFVSAK
jgi:tetratricopeptide (TPR) repeat protein